jgi:hypothetical protein
VKLRLSASTSLKCGTPIAGLTIALTRYVSRKLRQKPPSVHSTVTQNCVLGQMTSQPLIFQPFSAGPQLCLGQQFSYNSATIALIKISQKYDKIQLARNVQPEYTPMSHITLHWRGGMCVRFNQED